MKLILASTSPRRIEIFKKWNFDFEYKSPSYNETSDSGDPIKTVLLNAYGKAKSIQKDYFYDTIIGLDTVVEFQGKIIGKPLSKKHNRIILKKLSNKTHTVITGIAILYREAFIIDYAITYVSFREILKSEIEDYVSSNEGNDKAGGYAAQGIGSSFIKNIDGPLDNVIGMPIFAIKEGLYKINRLKK
jgi:septum formation protein